MFRKILLPVFVLTFLLAASSLLAQKLIAVQSGNQLTTYNNLDEAINAAAVGSDIYLPGGIFNYSNSNINKRVNIIGVGYNSNSNSPTGKTIINGTLPFIENADGGSVIGVECSTIQISDVENFEIKRCALSAVNIIHNCNNIAISESIVASSINGSYLTNTNVLIDRCFIGGLQGGYIASFNSLLLKNSIVFGAGSCYFGSCSYILNGVNNSVIENCILIDGNNCSVGFTNGTNEFKNCMVNCDTTLLSGQIVSNCIFNQALPNIFVNHSGNTFDINNNYHLTPPSPGNNAGTDGTDIGIYGTSQPFKDGGLPAYPHILFKNIAPATDQDGNLLINIQVEAQGN